MTEPQPLWLNLGCGSNHLPPPWKNHDLDMDIRQPLPFADNSVDRIAIEHCLEHVGSHEALRFLDEAYRVLRPDGTLRVCVPELTFITDPAHLRDLVLGHGHQMVYSFDALEGMLRAAGFSHPIRREARDSTIDGHWKVIGSDKDDMETLRVEARK